MAQSTLSQYVSSQNRATDNKKIYHSITVGHKSAKVFTELHFTPRGGATDKEGNPVYDGKSGNRKCYMIRAEKILEEPVLKWQSENAAYTQTPAPYQYFINTVKNFLNQAPCAKLVVFHDMQEETCDLRYQNHLHIITESDIRVMSKESFFRKMSHQASQIGAYATTAKINNVQGYINYHARSKTKIFLGASSEKLLEMFNNSEQSTITDFLLEGEINEPAECRFWDNALPPRVLDSQGVLVDANSNPCQPDHGEDGSQPPQHLMNSKSAQTQDYLYEVLKRFPECQNFMELLKHYSPSTSDYIALHSIHSSYSGNKQFDAAQARLLAETAAAPVFDYIAKLPDDIPEYMTPLQSVAFLNGWCRRHKISPKKWFTIWCHLLKGQGRKRIGLHLQGEGNSGKTMVTNTPFTCMKHLVGIRATDEWPWQVCGEKRIIVCEEAPITNTNLEEWKTCMSGSSMSCKRKGKIPNYCKADMVLINSNSRFTDHIDHKGAAILKIRMYWFEGLKPIPEYMKIAKGFIHPKAYTVVDQPSDEDVEMLTANVEDHWDDSYITVNGHIVAAVDTLEDIPLYVTDLDKENCGPEYEDISPEIKNKTTAHIHCDDNAVDEDDQSTFEEQCAQYDKELEEYDRQCWKMPMIHMGNAPTGGFGFGTRAVPTMKPPVKPQPPKNLPITFAPRKAPELKKPTRRLLSLQVMTENIHITATTNVFLCRIYPISNTAP